jgi:hypothetical protein
MLYKNNEGIKKGTSSDLQKNAIVAKIMLTYYFAGDIVNYTTN